MAATQDDMEESAEGAAKDCVSLPQSIVCSPPNFKWGDTEPESIVRTINHAYEEIVGWKKYYSGSHQAQLGRVSFVNLHPCLFPTMLLVWNKSCCKGDGNARFAVAEVRSKNENK